jgi:hypothetical protein
MQDPVTYLEALFEARNKIAPSRSDGSAIKPSGID